ncbi:uncharacterized protein BX663DRAFT_558664 [Cokeromyces recurvatus]|uniref:uncharacterized protein n=1 Tax=Cokeromyces recurvatus TaxID=90255 RepID=UPI00221FDD6D|nr:uncharacterized protein BX663DRAFT_558664 [Cokeromyces recurvatus]KAI7906104.1 hypothetical protein BX663DRAFT_558664 [Cokeromyces recurvatus]
MNLLSLLLGHYNNNNKPFYLYRFEHTSHLLFKFEDIAFLFNLKHDLLETDSVPCYQDKQNLTDIYLTTTELARLAIKHNKFLLAELCKLKPGDYAASLDESILSKLSRLNYHKSKKDDSQFTITQIQLQWAINQENSNKVKSEPTSPPSISTHRSDPMALDTMLIGAGSQQQTRRLSRTLEEQPNKKQKKNNSDDSTSIPHLPKPIHTVSSQQQASTLLAKRLGGLNNSSSNKNTRNLTIYTPSYGEQLNGIRSAPLHSKFPHGKPQQQQQQQPHPLSQATMLSPASSTTVNSEFAIPPIVPSQQQLQQQQAPYHQPPHTAHPSSIHPSDTHTTSNSNSTNNHLGYHQQHPHFPPRSPQYYPSTAYGHSFPVTSGRVVMTEASHSSLLPPKTPTTLHPNGSSSLQKQQFMQPFEHLFETIETTRTLKSTLDDQIRRSSTLIQTLQTSSTTIESLIRSQIKEAQKEILQRMEDSIETLFKRISSLERRMVSYVVTEQKSSDENNCEVRSSSQEPSSLLISPPTIVKSQQDIGPNEYFTMLETLRERLDKLERQLES